MRKRSTDNKFDLGRLNVVVKFVDDIIKQFENRRLHAVDLSLDERRPHTTNHVPVTLRHPRPLVFTQHYVQRTLHTTCWYIISRRTKQSAPFNTGHQYSTSFCVIHHNLHNIELMRIRNCLSISLKNIKSKGRLHQRYFNRQLVNLRLTLSGD